MPYGPNNMPIAQAEFIILSSDDEMIALEEVFRIACPTYDYRKYVGDVVTAVVELCHHERTAKEEIDFYAKTSYFLTMMPNDILSKHYAIYTVHVDGGVDTTDHRQDKRSVRQILAALAHNLRRQLALYQLYDEHGNLMFEYDPAVPFGSLEIRLRRL